MEKKIKSSDGKSEYLLTKEGANIVCNCPGFKHRGKCKHQAQLRPEYDLMKKLKDLSNI